MYSHATRWEWVTRNPITKVTADIYTRAVHYYEARAQPKQSLSKTKLVKMILVLSKQAGQSRRLGK
jgi:hypothetical protein